MKPEVTLVYNKAESGGGQKSVLLETKSEVSGLWAGKSVQVYNKVLRAHMRAYIMHVLNGHMYTHSHTHVVSSV